MKTKIECEHIKISSNCFLFRGGQLNNNSVVLIGNKNIFIIDPSFNFEKIKHFLAENTLRKTVIFTHAHSDHIGDDFSNVMSYADEILFSEPTRIFIEQKYFNRMFFGKINEISENDMKKFVYINNGESINECTFYLTPGHSIDSMCVIFKNCLITGDLLFTDGIGRTDFIYSDPIAMKKSLAFIKQVLINNPDYIVIPGHDEFGLAKDILKQNLDLIS